MTRLRSRRIATPEGIVPGVLVTEGERIARIDPHEAEYDEDLGELVLLPGLVDCHVHVNEPGRTEWEGFETATRAAAAGGVTTVVDMPLNCIPVTTTPDAFRRKLEATDGKLHVDTGFWGGVVPGNADAQLELAELGVLGSKAFLCHSGIDDFPNATEADLREAMPRLRDAGIPLLAHAELDLGDAPCPADAKDYDAWLRSRPPSWEEQAIALLIRLCHETGCPVHVVHLSAAGAIPMLREARAEGLPITVETCPHYLCLVAEQIPDGAFEYKCAPPIRGEQNRQRLWEALEEGVIDFVISDHSPCTPGLKTGGFGEAWGGIASLSLGLLSVWTEARSRGIALERIAEWMCASPARFAGQPRKGCLAPGFDADVVAFDPDAEEEIVAERLFFKHRVSPYLGTRVRGAVRATWLRGQRVFDGESFTAPHGRPLLRRHPS